MVKHGGTITESNRILKRIEDLLGSTGFGQIAIGAGGTFTIGGVLSALSNILTELQTQSTTLSTLDTNTDGIEGLLTTIDTVLDTIASRLTSSGSSAAFSLYHISATHLDKNGTNNIHTQLEDINAKLTVNTAAVNTQLTGVATSLNEVEDVLEQEILTALNAIDASVITQLTGAATSLNEIEDVLEQEILTELESIDQNWNLLSVNQLALANISTNTGQTENKLDDVNTELDSQTALLTTIKDNVVDIDNNTDTLEAAIDGLGFSPDSAHVETLTMVPGSLTQRQTIAAGQVEKVLAIKITGETTAPRVVTVGIQIDGSEDFELGNVTITNGTTHQWSDNIWDSFTTHFNDLRLTSDCELYFTAAAVTAAESIIAKVACIVEKINA